MRFDCTRYDNLPSDFVVGPWVVNAPGSEHVIYPEGQEAPCYNECCNDCWEGDHDYLIPNPV